MSLKTLLEAETWHVRQNRLNGFCISHLIIDAGLLVGGENDVDGLGGLDGHGRLLDDDLVADGHGLGDVAGCPLDILKIGGLAVAWKGIVATSSDQNFGASVWRSCKIGKNNNSAYPYRIV